MTLSGILARMMTCPDLTRPPLEAHPMKRTALILTSLLFSTIHAQTATVQTTLQNAVTVALPLDATVRTAQANLVRAQAANTAALADPSTLVVARLNAANDVAETQASLKAAQLGALQATVNAYTALLEAQGNVDLQTLVVQINHKALDIAQVKLGTGNATTLDVQNAQNTLNSGEQNLAAAQAELNLASSKMATLLGSSGPVRSSGVVTAPKLSATLASLQSGLSGLPSIVSASNGVSLAQLQVKLTSNDFTPLQTQQQAQTTLANAQRSLASLQQTASQSLASAYQAAQNAAELQGIAQSRVDAAQKQYDQDSLRLKSGTISAVELQSSQLTLKQAQFSLLQAQDNVLKAQAALSVVAGQNLTGLSLPN